MKTEYVIGHYRASFEDDNWRIVHQDGKVRHSATIDALVACGSLACEQPGEDGTLELPVPRDVIDRFECWCSMSMSDVRGQNAQANQHLKDHIVSRYAAGAVKAPAHYRYLAGRAPLNGKAIVVVDGVFDRNVYQAALGEAREEGYTTEGMQVYCVVATYSGPAIDIKQLADVPGASRLRARAQRASPDMQTVHA